MSRWIDAEWIRNVYADFEHFDNRNDWTTPIANVLAIIDDAPSIDRPKGEWIDEADKYDASFGIHDYRCSNCNRYADEYISGHEWYTAGKPNFCPHCGADMRERKESE